MKRCHHVFVTPCQMHVANEMKPAMKMVPRRPKYLFIGADNQQPMRPQHSYWDVRSALVHKNIQRKKGRT